MERRSGRVRTRRRMPLDPDRRSSLDGRLLYMRQPASERCVVLPQLRQTTQAWSRRSRRTPGSPRVRCSRFRAGAGAVGATRRNRLGRVSASGVPAGPLRHVPAVRHRSDEPAAGHPLVPDSQRCRIRRCALVREAPADGQGRFGGLHAGGAYGPSLLSPVTLPAAVRTRDPGQGGCAGANTRSGGGFFRWQRTWRHCWKTRCSSL